MIHIRHRYDHPWEQAAYRRRLLLMSLIVITTLAASAYMASILPYKGTTVLEAVLVACFALLFACTLIYAQSDGDNTLTEKEKEEFKGQVNLKYTGTIPLVEAVRLLALREGVEETSTLERVRALHDQGVLSVNEHDDLTSAFYLITDILMRKQIRDYKAGRRVSYYVDPDALTKRDRVMLLESLKAINNVRKRVHMEFTAEIF